MPNIKSIPEKELNVKYETFAFVSNKIYIVGELPFEILPGCYLRKANSSQVSMIKKGLEYIVAPTLLNDILSRYEMDMSEQIDSNGRKGVKGTRLPESEWRYYMVSTLDNGNINQLLHYAASISDAPLDLVTLIFHGENGSAGRGHRPQSIVNYIFSDELVASIVDVTLLAEIGEIYSLLIAANTVVNGCINTPKAMKAVQMLDEVTLLPSSSVFRVLGLFSILEMLISHNPKLEDKGDSITHQMKTKMPLLMRRFDKPMVLTTYFGETKSDKIWSQMYGYRSAIAHGGTPDFNSLKEQGYLRSAANANAFLLAVVKATIRNYLREPMLYDDLVCV